MLDKKTRAVVTATYQSGRQEKYAGKLKKDGTMYRALRDKVQALRAFPTVTDVQIEYF